MTKTKNNKNNLLYAILSIRQLANASGSTEKEIVNYAYEHLPVCGQKRTVQNKIRKVLKDGVTIGVLDQTEGRYFNNVLANSMLAEAEIDFDVRGDGQGSSKEIEIIDLTGDDTDEEEGGEPVDCEYMSQFQSDDGEKTEVGCDGDTEVASETGAEAYSDAGTDLHSETGTEVGSKAKPEVGSGAETEEVTEAGTEAYSDAGTDLYSEAGTDLYSETGTEVASEAGTEVASETGTGVVSKADTAVMSEAGTEAYSEAGTEAYSDAGTDLYSETGTEEGSKSKTEVGSGAETEADSEAGTEAASEAGMKAYSEADTEVVSEARTEVDAGTMEVSDLGIEVDAGSDDELSEGVSDDEGVRNVARRKRRRSVLSSSSSSSATTLTVSHSYTHEFLPAVSDNNRNRMPRKRSRVVTIPGSSSFTFATASGQGCKKKTKNTKPRYSKQALGLLKKAISSHIDKQNLKPYSTKNKRSKSQGKSSTELEKDEFSEPLVQGCSKSTNKDVRGEDRKSPGVKKSKGKAKDKVESEKKLKSVLGKVVAGIENKSMEARTSTSTDWPYPTESVVGSEDGEMHDTGNVVDKVEEGSSRETGSSGESEKSDFNFYL